MSPLVMPPPDIHVERYISFGPAMSKTSGIGFQAMSAIARSTMNSAICGFKGDYAFLSNFYPSRMIVHHLDQDWVCETAEHAYQLLKTVYLRDAIRIQEAPHPGAAKRIGRTVTIRAGWDGIITEEIRVDCIKVDYMEEVLRKKFAHQDLRDKLLATGDRDLVEGNNWGDTFWGQCDGVGHNYLGRLLMDLRKELRDGRDV